MELCPNSHPKTDISKNIVLLGDCVIHCHACGNTITKEVVSTLYLGDRLDENKRIWHLYYFYPELVCEQCGAFQSTYSVICQPREESQINYKVYKEAGKKPSGYKQ